MWTITNVASSSGEVTIAPTSVDAGSTDNDLVIRFMAQGSMDGGQVRVDLPRDSGVPLGAPCNASDAAKANYASIRISGGSLRDTAIGDDRVIAFFDEFGKGDVLTIRFDELEAQSDLGIAEFVIWSAGERGGEN